MSTLERESHLRENPFHIAQQQLRAVAETFHIDERLVNILQECKKAVEVSVPTSLDDGTVRAFTGYRVSTTSRAGRPRAASATTRRHDRRGRRSRCG